jgi:hypothetical protein
VALKETMLVLSLPLSRRNAPNDAEIAVGLRAPHIRHAE